MVFQDGHSYRDVKGKWQCQSSSTILSPRGHAPHHRRLHQSRPRPFERNPQSKWKASNRGFEYDSLGTYARARFLHDEILPEVEKRYAISKDPRCGRFAGLARAASVPFTVALGAPRIRFVKFFQRSAASRTCEAETSTLLGFASRNLNRSVSTWPIRVVMSTTPLQLAMVQSIDGLGPPLHGIRYSFRLGRRILQ